MTRRAKITPELYDKLVIAFREVPGNASRAAREADTTAPIAGRCWSKGYHKTPRTAFARPIRDVLREEVELARATRQKLREKEIEDEEKEREKARKDSIETIAEEALGARLSRKNAIAFQTSLTSLLRGIGPLADRTREALMTDKALKPAQVVKLLHDMAFALKAANEAVLKSYEIERLRLGEPTQILGIASSTDDASAEEIAEELLTLSRTLKRAQQQTDPFRYGKHKKLSDGTIVIDLPEEAYEEMEQKDPKPHKA